MAAQGDLEATGRSARSWVSTAFVSIRAASSGWFPLLYLAGVTFVVHFLLLSQFGLYEDDYFYTIPALGDGAGAWWPQVVDALLHPFQGRPLNHAVRRTLFHFVLGGGGLQAGYLLSWALISLNAYLVFRVVLKVTSETSALFAALIFIVYPSDTSRQLLMHQSDIHFGMLLLLIALNVYGTGRIVVSFAVASLTLVNYESFFLPFIAAPLIFASARRPSVRMVLLHGLSFFGLAGTVLLIRSLLGESRASDLIGGFGNVIGAIATAGPIGAWTSAQMIVLRPVDAFLHAEPVAWTIGVIIFIGTLVSYWRFPIANGSTRTVSVGALFLCGLGALIAWNASYLLAFRSDYYPPIMTIGRLSGIHAIGVIGAAILTGVLLEMARVCSKGTQFVGGITAFAMALIIGFSGAFGIGVQRSEYVAQWSKQIRHYREIIDLVPDLREGEIVVLNVEGTGDAFPITKGFPRFGMVNYTPLALSRFLEWPREWKTPPVIAPIWEGVPVQRTPQGLAVFSPRWRFQKPKSEAPLPPGVPVLSDDRFVMLAEKGGRLRRISGPVQIEGHSLRARAAESPEYASLSRSKLFKELTESRPQEDWFTLKHAHNYPP